MTKLYEANNHILIHTETLQPAEHSHIAAHIILSMNGSMKVHCAGAEYLCHGILVPSGIDFGKFYEVVEQFLEENLPENKRVFFLYTCAKVSNRFAETIKTAAPQKGGCYSGRIWLQGF